MIFRSKEITDSQDDYSNNAFDDYNNGHYL